MGPDPFGCASIDDQRLVFASPVHIRLAPARVRVGPRQAGQFEIAIGSMEGRIFPDGVIEADTISAILHEEDETLAALDVHFDFLGSPLSRNHRAGVVRVTKANAVASALGIEESDVLVIAAGNVGGSRDQVVITPELAVIRAILVDLQHLGIGQEL